MKKFLGIVLAAIMLATVAFAADITVTLDGKQVIRKKKQKLAPGEMETVALPVSLLKEADGKTLTVGIEVSK